MMWGKNDKEISLHYWTLVIYRETWNFSDILMSIFPSRLVELRPITFAEPSAGKLWEGWSQVNGPQTEYAEDHRKCQDMRQFWDSDAYSLELHWMLTSVVMFCFSGKSSIQELSNPPCCSRFCHPDGRYHIWRWNRRCV